MIKEELWFPHILILDFLGTEGWCKNFLQGHQTTQNYLAMNCGKVSPKEPITFLCEKPQNSAGKCNKTIAGYLKA